MMTKEHQHQKAKEKKSSFQTLYCKTETARESVRESVREREREREREQSIAYHAF